VGHEDTNCCAFNMMREFTLDMYIIQEDNVAIEGGGKCKNQRGFNQGNQG
jgi:hypothetical protein